MPVSSAKPPLPQMVRKPVPKKRMPFSLLGSVMLAGVLCALLIFAGIHFQRGQHTGSSIFPSPPPLWGSPGQKVILVMGVDAPNNSLRAKDENTFEGTRTDTMMLVRIDASKKRVAVVSIPRDSKVYISGNRGIDKINAAHAIGGADLAVQTVQESFGIPIDNFMVINFRGVRELVDAIGGVDLYVEKAMHYTDHTAKLYIDFKPGKQHLNGKQAEAFLRFRHDHLGDIGRIRRQQQFIMALTKKMRDPAILLRIPQLVGLAGSYVETDLSPGDLATLAFFSKDVNLNAVRTATLPGHAGGVRVSYWVIDSEAAQVVLDRLILDNSGPGFGQNQPEPGSPMKVGIFYDPALGDEIPAVVKSLEAKGFEVVCKNSQRRTGTQIVEHTSRVTDQKTDSLRAIDPRLANVRLIFAPVGTTFENNACSVGEDYTLVLGADSAVKR